MAIQTTDAIILKRWPYGETSLIVSAFTRDWGKLRGIVKGIRTEPQRYGSRLEPFDVNTIVFYPKRSSSLHLISQCEVTQTFSGLHQNLRRLVLASYAAELLESVTAPEDPHPELFDLLQHALATLAAAAPEERLARYLEIKFLDLSGFLPRVDACVVCEQPAQAQAFLSSRYGGLLCARCAPRDRAASPMAPPVIAALRQIIAGSWAQLAVSPLPPHTHAALSAWLGEFLAVHVDRRFRSMALFERLKTSSKFKVESVQLQTEPVNP